MASNDLKLNVSNSNGSICSKCNFPMSIIRWDSSHNMAMCLNPSCSEFHNHKYTTLHPNCLFRRGLKHLKQQAFLEALEKARSTQVKNRATASAGATNVKSAMVKVYWDGMVVKKPQAFTIQPPQIIEPLSPSPLSEPSYSSLSACLNLPKITTTPKKPSKAKVVRDRAKPVTTTYKPTNCKYDKIERLAREGKTVKDIAREVKCGVEYARRVFRLRKLPFPVHYNTVYLPPEFKNEEERNSKIIELSKQGLGKKAIAGKVGCSRNHVEHILWQAEFKSNK